MVSPIIVTVVSDITGPLISSLVVIKPTGNRCSFGNSQIDRQLELGGLLDRQVGGFCPFNILSA
jgi:hypothetical protein